MKRATLLASALLLTCSSALCQDINSVLDMPYPVTVKYLPGPPDSLSMAFAYDVNQYMYYKTLRESERGQQAQNDVSYGVTATAQRMEGVFGVNAADPNLPDIYSFFGVSLRYISQSCGAAKTYYNRRRPFDRFNDPLFSTESPNSLRLTGSYPSAHSMYGWSSALLLSEVNPSLQDDLYNIGYEYGQSRLIVGAHWHSDVVAARLMSEANFARLHANEDYLAAVSAAQAAYDSLTHHQRPTALAAAHPLVTFLPAMPDSTGAAFAHDVTSHFDYKTMRDGERGALALSDADMTVTGISQAFAPILHLDITPTHSPKIYQLLETAIAQAQENVEMLQSTNPRTPPYLRLNDPPMPGTVSTSASCFPSQHAAVGWLAGLLLMDVCPTYQNELLARGLDYGQSRVIAGTNWQSDVDAGQLLGGMVFATLMSDASMRTLLTEARHEFNQLTLITTVQENATDKSSIDYTIDGRLATPETRGVIVSSDGQKSIR